MASVVGPTDATVFADDARELSEHVAPTVVAGRYEILGLLGMGGMGRVYRAKDRELGETVALKVLHRDFVGSDEMIERFRQEVRLARKVTHRNVARTFDIGEHEGEKFLTMELVTGEALSARLERGLLDTREAIAIACEVVAGMAAAHAVGVVHRDLKPDNVLLEALGASAGSGSMGRVVITDFGIARGELGGSASKTSGRTIGTPAYMAPEQIGGQADIDARADIYAFGAMLFEMLTGQRAWPGTSALAVAAARLVQPPPDPRVHQPGLSPSVVAVVMRCLARDRNERFATDAELLQALLAADPSGAKTPSILPRAMPETEAGPRERSIAVMPFRNLGPAEDAYLSLGLTEDLVDVLSTVRGLRVRGRGYDIEEDRDIVDTGRRLGVDVVVDGSVRRAAQTLRVSARLVGVADGFQLWSSRFDRPVGEAFALNDEVAHAIAAALAAEHAVDARAQPTDPAAVDLYFRAKHSVGRFWTMTGPAESRDLFVRALTLAPNDPTILAGFVSSQVGRNFFAPLDGNEAATLVTRALRAGEHLADPWIALAAVRFNHSDDPPGAIRALKRALVLSPSSADAHDLTGRILLEADQVADGVKHLERALWTDPHQRWARVDLIRAAALQADWTRARELAVNGPGPEWLGHRSVHEARLWSWPGAPKIDEPPVPVEADYRFGTLIALFRGARDGRSWVTTSRAPGTTRRNGDVIGSIRAATASIMGVAPPRSRSRRFFTQLMAELAAITGHEDVALQFVEEAVNDGLLDLAWLNRLPLLEPLRGNARFEELRQLVATRAQAVVVAWQGPAETLADALTSLEASMTPRPTP